MAEIGGVSPVASFLSAERDEELAAQRYVKTDAATQYALKDFQTKASSVHSAADLMKNYSLEKVVLNAYGLGGLQGQPAVVRALLTQDPASPNSLAMKSRNASWMAFARDFASLGRNNGKASETTSLSMSGPVGSLFGDGASGSSASGQSYSPPTVTAHTADGQAYQIGLSWTQSGNDPSSWTVTAYAVSSSTGHMAGVADGAFSVGFNADGSLGSIISPSGTVINKAGADGRFDLNVSYDGVAQTVSLDLGTIGQKNGVSLAQSPFDVPQSSVSTLGIGAKPSTVSMSAEYSTANKPGNPAGNVNDPARALKGAAKTGTPDPLIDEALGNGQKDSAVVTQDTANTPDVQAKADADMLFMPSGTMIGSLSGDGQAYMTAPAQLRDMGPDGKETSSLVSAKWLQASSVPPVWQVQLVDPATGSVYSDAYEVTFDDKGQIASVSDFSKQVSGGGSGTSVPANGLAAQINGRTWHFDIGGAGLRDTALSGPPDVHNPLVAQYSSTPFHEDLMDRIARNYELNAFEGAKGNKANGVGDALYFMRKIGDVHSVEQLMSDSRLLRVAEVVSGYDPDVIGGLDFDQQLRIMKKSINLKDFSTPQSAQRYSERYLVTLQNNPQYINNDQPNTLLDLFGGDSGGDYNDQIVLLFS